MSKPKPLYMETTEISAERTAGEITSLLVAAGARSISMDYAEGGKVVGMHFVLMIGGLPYPFKMPVRTQAVHEIFRKRRIATMKWRAHEFERRTGSRPSESPGASYCGGCRRSWRWWIAAWRRREKCLRRICLTRAA